MIDTAQQAEIRQAEADFWKAGGKVSPPAPPPSPPTTDSGLFTPESIWNQPHHEDKLRDLYEAELVAYIDADIQAMGVKSIWMRPFVVPDSTPRQPVTMLGYGPEFDPAVNPPLEHLSGLARVMAQGVPIPEHFGVSPDVGADKSTTIRVAETGEYFEFYYAGQVPDGEPNAGSWYTVGGAAIKDIRRFHGGGYDVTAYPPFSTAQWGTRASGLPHDAGMVTVDEMRAGVIPHAVAWFIPYPKLGWVGDSARRTDATAANTDRLAVSYGYHYRWNYSESEIRAMGLTPLATMLLIAMADYGFIPVDRTQSYAPVMDDGFDWSHRHGGADPFTTEVEGVPPIYRSSDAPGAPLTPYQDHFTPLWLDPARLQVYRRVLTWPARSADNAY